MNVSVVIPAYLAADTLPRAVGSALADPAVQEIVLVIDASPDHTADVAARLAEANPRVKVVDLVENVGPAGARNVGVRSARSEWIAFLDADDRLVPRRFSSLASSILKDADVIVDAVVELRDDGTPLGILRPDPSAKFTVSYFVDRARPDRAELDYGLARPIVRRSFLLRTHVAFDTSIRHAEDFRFLFDLHIAGARFRAVPSIGYLWQGRRTGASVTKEDYSAVTKDSLDLIRPGMSSPLEFALRRRAVALTRFSAWKTFTGLIRAGRLADALLLVRHDPALLAYAAQRWRKRLYASACVRNGWS